MRNKAIIVIPARYKSTRLPGKVLLKVNKKTIIQLVYEQAILVKNCDNVVIATDSNKVFKECKKFTDNVVLSSEYHQTGTDRVAEACQNIDTEYIVNIQGDEPLINPNTIATFIEFMKKSNESMHSMFKVITNIEDVVDRNTVKVILDKNRNALYFSRTPLPNYRDLSEEIQPDNYNCFSKKIYYKHIGVYGYKNQFLLAYSKMNVSYLENAEKLEQLRAIENGFKIGMMETFEDTVGIDTYEDYNKLLKYFNIKL
jgi:3-deoxy-manno-octulosonate cytidylyltransferase (CMP-KDO synthetase)